MRTVSPPQAWLEPLEDAARAGYENEAARLESFAPHHYVSRAPSSQDPQAYSFQLAGGAELAPGTAVCLGEAPQLRGRVVRGYGRMVTVLFDGAAEPEKVRGQGTLKVLPSDRAFTAQREAVTKLRQGRALNPRLVEVLAAGRFAPYEPAQDSPDRSLDAEQLDAFQRALAVPDLLTVLGPPGSGKSTTIAEVIQACVRRGERVLLTAPTHRAVDDVLELLAADIDVVRLGGEDVMSAKVTACAAPNRAQELRQRVLADTAVLEGLTKVQRARPELEKQLAHLRSALDLAQSAESRLAGAGPAIEQALHRAAEAVRAQQRQAERDLVKHRSILASTEAGLTGAFQSATSLQSRAEENKRLSFAYRWAANHQRRRTERFAQALPRAKAAAEAAQAHQAHLSTHGEALVTQDATVLRLQAESDQAQHDLAQAWPRITAAAEQIRLMLQVAQTAPEPADATIAGWAGFHTACAATLSAIDRRAELLQEWRSSVAGADLENEIARYADVVAVTCLGGDSATVIAELEFDLAIVDESDRVNLPNLVVPLVNARRAVLFGDGFGPASFAEAPPENAIWLTTQRRMPRQIAEFVSSAYYGGRLRTEHRGGGAGDVFGSPLAMVNTADRPADERAETGAAPGFRNELEAGLLASIVARSRGRYRDWAVVVEGEAQRELVIGHLREQLGTSARLGANVHTAATFSGERDLIVFGFTRSNTEGDIGELAQPRLLHAALTGARRQLVLVGDLDTLFAVKDQEFQALMTSLRDHLTGDGELRGSVEIACALEPAEGRQP